MFCGNISDFEKMTLVSFCCVLPFSLFYYRSDSLLIYSKDIYHLVIGDIKFHFEDDAIQSYVPEMGF